MKIKTLIVNGDSLIHTKNHWTQWTLIQQINMDTEVSGQESVICDSVNYPNRDTSMRFDS